MMLSRTVFHYIDHKRDDRAVRQRIREIAETRVRVWILAYPNTAETRRLDG